MMDEPHDDHDDDGASTLLLGVETVAERIACEAVNAFRLRMVGRLRRVADRCTAGSETQLALKDFIELMDLAGETAPKGEDDDDA